MDLNFGHATLLRYFATSYLSGLESQQAEQEMAAPTLELLEPRTSWTRTVREWSGARLVLLGRRIAQAADPKPVDIVMPS